MSMPIQRQSEQFAAFDSAPRWERDRGSHDLPKGLAALINTTGPRIQAGLLDTRNAGYTMGDSPFSPGWGPRDHGGAGPDGGPANPPEYYEDESDEDEDEEFFDPHHGDPERYVPEHLVDPRTAARHASRHPFDRTAACQECGEEIEPENSWEWTHSGDDYYEHTAEPSPEDEAGRAAWEEERGIGGRGRDTVATRLAKDGDCTCWEGYERVPGTEPCASKSCRKKTSALRLQAFSWDEQRYISDDPRNQRYYSEIEHHKAPLENGHELHAWKYTKSPDAADGWQWAISDPHSQKAHDYANGYEQSVADGTYWDVDPTTLGSPPPAAARLAMGGTHAPYEAQISQQHIGHSPEVAHSDHIPTLDDAKAQAQAHYESMFPIGTNTGSHDSGTDYSDLNSYMRHLESMRLAADAAPAVDPAQMQVPDGGGFRPGHRVAIDWRGKPVAGIVTDVGPNIVNVIWHDSQKTSESPGDLRLL